MIEEADKASPMDMIHKISTRFHVRRDEMQLCFSGEYTLLFDIGINAAVYLSVAVESQDEDYDLVIKIINVLPHSERRKGHGRRAIEELIEASGARQILATQVQADEFFLAIGFEPLGNSSNDYVYTRDVGKIIRSAT